LTEIDAQTMELRLRNSGFKTHVSSLRFNFRFQLQFQVSKKFQIYFFERYF